MFNRKISSESFDDSLEEFEDFLHDPLLTRDIPNKSTSNDTSTVDLETGEILSPQPRDTTRNTRKRSLPTPPENSRTTQPKGKDVFITPFSFLLPVGSSLFFCLIIGLVGYFIFDNKLSELSLQAKVTSEKVTNLDNLVKELQMTYSSEESEEVLSQLEDLSIGLEDVEVALQKHTQTTKHALPLPAIKKSSPNDSLKNVAYLGFYGTSTQPIAIIRIKDQQKELLTGQSVTELWQLTSIHPNHILVTHPDGLTQQIARKKSLF